MRDRARPARHTNERGAADENGADDGEKITPIFGGEANPRESECRVKPRDGRWHRKDKGERAANSRRFRNGEDDPAGDERSHGGAKPNDERTDDAGAIVERGEYSGDADEKWRRVDGEREQHPAEEAGAEEAERKSDDDHGGGLREIDF